MDSYRQATLFIAYFQAPFPVISGSTPKKHKLLYIVILYYIVIKPFKI